MRRIRRARSCPPPRRTPDASATPATPDANAAPAGPNVEVPSAAAKPGTAAAKVAAAEQSTPYGIAHLWEIGSWIDKFIMIVLAIMSAGTWYIFFTKFIDQARILGDAKTVDKKFWTAASLNEGIDKLPQELAVPRHR